MNIRVILCAACLMVTQIASAATIFVGQFDVSNFTLDAMGGNGSVDTSLAPGLIEVTGHTVVELGSSTLTTYLVTVQSNATFNFYWEYSTDDSSGQALFDSFGSYLNGALNQLTDDNLGTQSGFQSLNLTAGDIFGFYIDSIDGCCGAGHAKISGDPIGTSGVPEPSSVALLVLGVSSLGLLRRRMTS